ncbi:MAG TPA: DUF1599 domain-containing protein [Saprospiraceae bacterium]|nr:DUF1599 domain-containing protein [Saprospiraceae bacterium]
MMDTLSHYEDIFNRCREIFLKKHSDYGSAWRILRPSSLTDQLLIKARRIRQIQEKGLNLVDEPIDADLIGIVNYSIMALIQLDKDLQGAIHISSDEVLEWYEKWKNMTRELMLIKNHDYGEAWRDMRISSITDMILMKLLRIKSIEENHGKTIISEGLEANYQDIINYAVFALILLEN